MQGPNNPKFIPVSGNLGNTNEMIDLDDIFDDDFFPADLDFSSFFGQLDNVPKDPTNSEGAPSLDAIRGINSNVPYNGNTENTYVNGNNSIPYVSNQNGDINGNNGRDNLYANIKLENPNQNQFQNQSQNVNQNQSVNQYQTVVKEEAGEEMDWDYLLSLGIGPAIDDGSSSSTITNKSQAFDEQQINSENQRALKSSRKNGLIMIPPLMPRTRTNSIIKPEVKTVEEAIIEEDIKGEDEDSGVKKRKKMKSIDPKDMTEEQMIERRERNREHAKKSRIRKRVLLDLLQDQLSALRGENVKLRRVVIERLPHVASKVFEQCTTEESMLLIDSGDEEDLDEDEFEDEEGKDDHILGDGNGNSVTISNSNSRRMRKEMDRQRRDRILGSFQVHLRQHPDEITANNALIENSLAQGQELTTMNTAIVDGNIVPLNTPKQTARILMEPDFRLIEALIHSQQNFVLSDPSLPDNPIVYCSEGFCKLTGYKRQHILGRNCRFLQGPGTDQGAVDIIRKGVLEGCDISVCLLNYKADGSPFWNQFFVAALKDSAGEIINYVGVQCEVNTLPIEEIKDRVKRLPVPDL
mmetsp:Transcript_5934/g.6056  ORF Transcript_5934/g.6056 Transcript_5934/m.6056 type:complete len:580 (-) Transcript_5934:223-1962(-)